MENEIYLKIAAFVVSIFVLVKGLKEYQKNQQWKKSEFLSKEMKDFFNNFDIRRALIMLDWNAKKIDLANNEIPNQEQFHFNDQLLSSSLTTHLEKSSFRIEKTVVKKCFDTLFDQLSIYEVYIQTRLINAKDLSPYLKYYIRILSDKDNYRKNTEIKKKISQYLKEYSYTEVEKLLKRPEFYNV